MTSSIEKIRAQCEAVRKEHKAKYAYPDGTMPHCGACGIDKQDWPCPTLRLAEDRLKLAEALEAIKSEAGSPTVSQDMDHTGFGFIFKAAERVLREVSE